MKKHYLFSKIFFKNFDKDEIFCMAKVAPRQTGLATRLYLDDNGTYHGGGHWKRIKFQHDENIVDGREWCPMDFNSVVRNPHNRFKIKISQSDLNDIKIFVQNNVYALNALCDIGDFVITDFLQVMIPGGKPATPEQIEEQKRKTDAIIATL